MTKIIIYFNLWYNDGGKKALISLRNGAFIIALVVLYATLVVCMGYAIVISSGAGWLWLYCPLALGFTFGGISFICD